MRFERLKPGQAELLREIAREDGLDDRPAAIESFLSADDNLIYAGHHEERLVAYAYGYLLERPTGGKMQYIHSLAVLKDVQRQGIGQSFLTFIIEQGQKLGVAKTFLFTDIENLPANRLYEKLGGELSHDHPSVYFFKIQSK